MKPELMVMALIIPLEEDKQGKEEQEVLTDGGIQETKPVAVQQVQTAGEVLYMQEFLA